KPRRQSQVFLLASGGRQPPCLRLTNRGADAPRSPGAPLDVRITFICNPSTDGASHMRLLSVLTILLVPLPLHAELVSLEILHREPFADGQPFGDAGPY